MKHPIHRLLGFVITAVTLSVNPVKADFGEADVSTVNTFDAWCGQKGNNCTIRFEKDAIVVDNISKVSHKQITAYSNLAEYDGGCWGTTSCLLARNLYSIDIEYIKQNGAKSNARILFANPKSYRDFMYAIKSYTGISSSGEIDLRCPSGGKLIEGNCLSTEQANHKRVQDALLWLRASEGITNQQQVDVDRQRLETERNRLPATTIQNPLIIINR